MKKLLLILICLFVSFPVKSEWIKMLGPPDIYPGVYINKNSVNREQNLITYWRVTNLPTWNNTIPNGKKYLSCKSKRLTDCKLRRSKNLRSIFTTMNMGKGEIVYDTRRRYEFEWYHPSPEEPLYEEIEFLCGNF